MESDSASRARLIFSNEARTQVDLLDAGIDALPTDRVVVVGAVSELNRLAGEAVLEDVLAILAEIEMETDLAEPDKELLRRLIGQLRDAIAATANSVPRSLTFTSADETPSGPDAARLAPQPDPELWACFVDEARARIASVRGFADRFAVGDSPTVETTCELIAIRDAAATVSADAAIEAANLLNDDLAACPLDRVRELGELIRDGVSIIELVCGAVPGAPVAEEALIKLRERSVELTGIVTADTPVATGDAPPSVAAVSAGPSEAAREPSMLDDEALMAELRTVFRGESAEQIESLNQLLLALERNPSPDTVQKIFRITHTLKGSAGTVGLTDVAHLAHEMEDIFARVRDGRAPIESLKFNELFRQLDTLATSIGLPAPSSGAGEQVSVETASAEVEERADSEDRSVRVTIDRLDAIGNASAELAIGQTRLQDLFGTLRDATKSVAQHRANLAAAIADLEREGATRRLALLEYDMADTLNGLERLLRTFSAETRLHQRTLTSLRDQVMRTRWVALRGTFRRLLRPVRDLAQEIGKRVRLVSTGEETEIDRTLAEAMVEPLIQMARNSVAHGIEFPAERRRAGKDETGTVKISARHQASSVVIEVADDGTGLDPVRIRETAVSKGLVDQEVVDAIPDDKILDAIFLPGFTTRASADLVSGRGVGLDVVATSVARLGGTVQIASRVGEGTRFIIKLPLTLAVLQTLDFRLGRQTFALSLASVDGTVRVMPRHFEFAGRTEGIRYRGQWLPVVRLRRLWGLREDTKPPWPAVVVDIVQRRYAILVDELIGRSDVVVKSLGAFLAPLRLYLGAAIAGRGGVRPIIDAAALWEFAAHPRTARAPRPEAVESRGVILVVDDSLIIRKVVAQLLEQNGYRVLLATDGRDAWNMLKTHVVDMIISDLEMPRMHGFELLERLKESPIHAATPVLILSSRATRGNRARVLELGAADFLPKPVNERTVLESVRAVLQRN